MTEYIERLKSEYFNIGTQYYLAARFLAFPPQAPVVGNLFHHAIEMYLKGHLSVKLPESYLKGTLRHKLENIWREFKNDAPHPALARFDKTIAALHRFESIRYPEEIVKKGMLVKISFEKPPPEVRSGVRRKEPKYEAIISDIDELVAVIFEKSSVSPSYYAMSLSDEARACLTRWNKTKIWEK